MRHALRFFGIIGTLPAFIAGTGIAARAGADGPLWWGLFGSSIFVLMAVIGSTSEGSDSAND